MKLNLTDLHGSDQITHAGSPIIDLVCVNDATYHIDGETGTVVISVNGNPIAKLSSRVF